MKHPRGCSKAYYLIAMTDAEFAEMLADDRRMREQGGVADSQWLGNHVFITHGYSDGSVAELQQAKLAQLVICCHPAQVQARHPELRVFGNWTGSTYTGAEWRAGRGYTLIVEHAKF